jgi:eukaryotic translation initiation factor 2C
MIKVQSTRLPYPAIQYKGTFEHVDDNKAKWNLGEKRFLSTTDHDLRYTILQGPKVNSTHVEDIVENFEKQLKLLSIGTPTREDLVFIRTDEDALRQGLQEAHKQDVDLVVLILSHKSQDVYSTFKYLADRIFGNPTIVIVTDSNFKKIKGGPREWNPKGLDEVVGNIMMKVNLKMGGINHSALSSLGNIDKWLKDTLVLGADVTHPSSGALPGSPSVAAVVGSVESTGGCFLGDPRLQKEGGTEVSLSKRDLLTILLTSLGYRLP